MKTIRRFLDNPKYRKGRSDKGKFRSVTARDTRHIKHMVKENPGASSKTIFAAANISNVSKSTRNVILKNIAIHRKACSMPPLTPNHRQRRLQWARQYTGTPTDNILYTDECRATLDGPDGWNKGWISKDAPPRTRFRRQQGGGGVMFWAGIIGNELIGPVMVPDGVKINATTYCEFLWDALSDWLDQLPLARRKHVMFMHDNAPAHSAKKTRVFLRTMGFQGDNLMKWPASSPDLNPIENLWAIIKRDVFLNGRQFSSKIALWNAVQVAAKGIKPDTIKKLTQSTTGRIFKVIENDGSYINK